METSMRVEIRHNFSMEIWICKKIYVIFATQMRNTIVHKAPWSLFSQCDYRGIEMKNPFQRGRFVAIYDLF